MRDPLVVLARIDEVEFFGVGSDLAGRFPEIPTEAAPDDAASGALDADELARLQAMADEFWADDEEVEL